MVIFVIDTLRADHLGCYGGRPGISPAIDRLASSGVVFEQAVTAAPRTWQSFTSILTALYPVNHGVRYIFDEPLSPKTPTLASWLKKAGYRTAAFDAMTFLRGMMGGRGFKDYFDPSSLRGAGLTDTRLMDAFVKWIGRSKQPSFAFLRLGGPHWPYQCKPSYHDESVNDAAIDHSFNAGSYGIGLAGHGKGIKLVDPDAYRRLHFNFDFKPGVREHMILHYDECVRASDEVVGMALKGMRRAGLLEKSLVIVTSDHGESFGEHGYLQHGSRVDDPVMRVPLIMRFPSGMRKGREGVRISQLVRTVDIAPTVLATLALTVPANVDGVSLLDAVDSGTDLKLSAYGESGREFVGVDPERYVPGVRGKHRMLRTGRWKLIYVPDQHGGRYRLFDLRADPGETTDVAASHPQVMSTMKSELMRLMTPDMGSEKRERSLSEKEKEQLRALGYL